MTTSPMGRSNSWSRKRRRNRDTENPSMMLGDARGRRQSASRSRAGFQRRATLHSAVSEQPDDLDDEGPTAHNTPNAPGLVSVVRELLAPLVEADGGHLEFLGLDRGVAEVRLSGACAGCPGQSYTANAVLLPALRAIDPTVT